MRPRLPTRLTVNGVLVLVAGAVIGTLTTTATLVVLDAAERRNVRRSIAERNARELQRRRRLDDRPSFTTSPGWQRR